MGREADVSVAQQYGIYDDPELQAYIQDLGMQLARVSERPDLPWKFAVVDDSIVNAFALPGGFVYVSRGILAHVASEAELMGVLGHEVGHVTARHSVEQMSRAQLAGLGLGVASVASRDVRQWGGLAGAGLQVAFLKFGRDDERQSDSLGLRYVVRAGYDPTEMPKIFHTLDRVSQAAGSGRIPTWQSTHPDPGARSQTIARAVSQLAPDEQRGTLNREIYLAHLEGMTFGANPREGFTVGSTFYHPDLAFRLDFPSGWQIVNQRSQVGALSPEKDAIVVLSLVQGSADQAAAEFRNVGGIVMGSSMGRNMQRFETVSDNPNDQVLTGVVRFVEHRDVTLRLLAYTLDSRWRNAEQPLVDSVDSFGSLSDPRYLDVQPKRLELVELPRPMSLSDFAEAYPSSVDRTTLAIINGVSAEDVLEKGQVMKRIVGGDLPDR
ncbi:MAG: M48 family metalloprotease [Thermoanaerobaculia bacterium]|nr:M48 family metalloprotease [Thermoanaerobaculia bacterium]